MSAFAIVTGALFRAPEQRTSKAGKPFVTATIRAKDGDAPMVACERVFRKRPNRAHASCRRRFLLCSGRFQG